MAAISRERRRHVVRLVKRVGLHQAPLTDDARLTYVISALVADDTGYVAQQAVIDAARDPKVVALAASILTITSIDAGA